MTKKIGIFLFGLMLFFMITEIITAASFTNSTLVSSTAGGAKDVISADIDNDGDLDIISANYNDDKIEWYENNDDGTFNDGVSLYDYAYDISTIDVGDFNQDGYIDIVLATYNGGDGEIIWLINNQDNTFSFENWIYSSGNFVSVVYVADIDNDGDLDIIGGLEGDNLVTYFENNGSGIFSAVAAVSGTNVVDIKIHDIDNDGWLDLIIANDNSVNVHLNNKNDNFSPPTYTINGLIDLTSVDVADINGDGLPDVLTTNQNNVLLHIFTGSNYLPALPIDDSLSSATSVKAIDIDNDGDLDIIAAGHTFVDEDVFQLYYNDGGSLGSGTRLDSSPTWVSQFVIDDFDTDGDQDIVYVTFDTNSVVYIENDLNEDYTMIFHENGGDVISKYEIVNDNLFLYDSQIDTDSISDTHLYDFNNDGFIDIINSSTSTDSITALASDGAGGYVKSTLLAVDNPSDFWIGDLNADGNYDIITINGTTDNFVWFMGDGLGGFTEKVIQTNVTKISDIIVDDIDDDGDLDIIVSLPDADDILMYLNNNDDTFTTSVTLDLFAPSLNHIESIDIDNDGDLDILAPSNGQNTVFYYLNNGNGTFNSRVSIGINMQYAEHVEIGDFNSDGWMDIAVLGSTNGDLYIVLNNHDLTFTLSQTVNNSMAGNALTVYDFDHDGDLDVVSINGSNKTKIVFNENDGTGLFSLPQDIDNTNYMSAINVLDYDFNGTLDLVVSGPINGTNIISNTVGQLFEITGPTYLGHTFNGWYSDSGLTVPYDDTKFLTGDEELWASWSLNTWTLTYEDFDNSLITSGVYDYGDSLGGSQPADPTRAGYTFIGWEPATPSTMPDNDLTIIAVYDANYYDFTYYDWDSSIHVQDSFAYETDLTGEVYPSEPVRTGYTFDGWSIVIPDTMPANNVEFEALYTHTEYTIIFEDHDGTLIDSYTYFYDDDTSAVLAQADPTRTGYTFNDWNDILPTVMPEGNVVLTALYFVNSYTIEYFENDGSRLSITTYEYGADLSGVVEPTPAGVAGQHFVDWDTTLPATMPAYNIEINPNFVVNEYPIEYQDFDGTILKTETYEYGADLSGFILPSNPTRVGYTFDGWDTTLPGTMPDNSITVTATYVINTYTVTYYEKDGSVLSVYTFDFDVELTSHVTPIPSEVVGYTFTSWNSSVPSNMPANNIDIYPGFTKNSYPIEYQDYDGTVLKTETYEFEDDLSGFVLPNEPTRVGYTFDGWDLTLPSTMPDNSITVTATYIKNTYTIEYEDYDGTELKTETFEYEADLSGFILPSNPTRVGYTFDGWNTTLPGTMPSNSITVTATYVKNTYTVEYQDHDGTVLKTEVFEYEADLSGFVLPVDPTRIGYEFNEWDSTLPATMPANDITV
ncbi:MAG: FG-GAP-like repeat-containing protein, partial [Candidatus Izemoplasma sp.]